MTAKSYPERGGLGASASASSSDFSTVRAAKYSAFAMVTPASGTTSASCMTGTGTAFTNAGSPANNDPTPATLGMRYVSNNCGNVLNGVAYHRQNAYLCWRGNAAGLGGFRFVLRFGLDGICSGSRAFMGLSNSLANPTNFDPMTLTSYARFGLAIKGTPGNWNILHGTINQTPTAVDLGSDFQANTTDVLELVLESEPNASSVQYTVTNLSTGEQATGTISTNLPDPAWSLAPVMMVCGNSSTETTGFRFYRWTLETPL